MLDLLRSKKFRVALLTVIGMIATKLGVPETTVTELITVSSPLLVYIVAQGLGGDRKDAQREAIEAARADAVVARENQLADEARREAQYK